MVEYLSKPYFIAVLICIFTFYSGIFQIPEANPLTSLISQKDISFIEGQMISSPSILSNKKFYSCRVQVASVKSKKNITSSAKGIITVFIPSNMIEAFFPGKIYSSVKDKGVALFEAGGNFVFKGKFSKSVFYVEKTKALGFNKNIFGKIDLFRAKSRLQFKKLMYSWKDAGGFLLALLSGSKEYLEEKISIAFRLAGLSHIMALSGMHLSLFSGIALFIGKRSKRNKIAFIIRLIFLILFVWFAGFSPSLLRAFICAMLMIFSSIATKNPPDMILILCFSFLLQCVISPDDIKSIGFILSYSALAGILFFNNGIKKIINPIFSNYFSSSISASASAQIFTAPISLKIFRSFYPIGIIATSVISPLVTIYIYSGLILIILSLIFPSLSGASGIFVNFEYNIIKNIVIFFSKAPFWSIN